MVTTLINHPLLSTHGHHLPTLIPPTDAGTALTQASQNNGDAAVAAYCHGWLYDSWQGPPASAAPVAAVTNHPRRRTLVRPHIKHPSSTVSTGCYHPKRHFGRCPHSATLGLAEPVRSTNHPD